MRIDCKTPSSKLVHAAMFAVCVAALAGCQNDDPHVFGSSDAGLVDGSGGAARFSNPVNVEVAPDGTVYVADFDNDALRVITTDGVVHTLVHQNGFSRPFGLTLAPDGSLYAETDGNDTGQRDATTGTVWHIDVNSGAATVVARNLGRPRGLQALLIGGNLRIAMSDLAHDVISLLNPADGTVQVIAGTADQAGLVNDTGAAARFSRPYGLALASDGSLLVADQNNNAIRRVTLAGVVTTFAGGGAAGNSNGPIASASFNAPEDVAVHGDTVFVADQANHLIRKISGGQVSTEAGNGTQGFVDADGTAAEFFGLEGLAVTADGATLWVADGNNGDGDSFNRVRKLKVQ